MSKETNQESVASTRPPGISPFCQFLESKKLMGRQDPPLTNEDVLDASNHVWCGHTMTILGPDGHQCHPDSCASKKRACFESPLKDLL